MATISFLSLLREEEAGDRRIPVVILRSAFLDVNLRTWQSWRERCNIPKFARRCSRLAAMRLWILACSNGKLDKSQIRADVAYRIEHKSENIERWLDSLEGGTDIEARERGSLYQDVVSAITELAPDIVIRRRASLYEWFERAGYTYRSGNEYSQYQLMRVISEARKSKKRAKGRRSRAVA